jgi:hypothetical protein
MSRPLAKSDQLAGDASDEFKATPLTSVDIRKHEKFIALGTAYENLQNARKAADERANWRERGNTGGFRERAWSSGEVGYRHEVRELYRELRQTYEGQPEQLETLAKCFADKLRFSTLKGEELMLSAYARKKDLQRAKAVEKSKHSFVVNKFLSVFGDHSARKEKKFHIRCDVQSASSMLGVDRTRELCEKYDLPMPNSCRR